MKTAIISLMIMMVSFPGNLFAQKAGKKYDITGQVVDANDKPVSGAVVLVDSKSTGVFTDDKGTYQVKVKANATKIAVIKLPNGQSEEEINGRTAINFKLGGETPPPTTEVGQSANDEVINMGYGSATKKALTTTIRKIDGDNKNGSYQNIYEMLMVDPSVQVSGSKITIRGINSINSTDPLLIVNGVPVSSIEGISPQSVKSIEILKGSEASIYGSRGANGVVMITLTGSGK